MIKIIAKLKEYDTTEGCYKNISIAKKHKRRLEKKNPGTTFKLERIEKDNSELRTFYAVKGHIERGEL